MISRAALPNGARIAPFWANAAKVVAAHVSLAQRLHDKNEREASWAAGNATDQNRHCIDNAHRVPHAGEENVSLQIDTAPIENPPLPRPKPSLNDDLAADNPAVLISAFRHQNGEESVAISSALTRIAQAQTDAMAIHDSLDHNALAPFSSRIGRSGFSRAAENIAFGHADFASTLKQ